MNRKDTVLAYLTNEKRLLDFFGGGFMAGLAVIICIPFYFVIVSSLKSLGQYASVEFRTMWFPFPLHPENYRKAVEQYKLLNYMWNSIWLGSVQTALTVFSSCVVAYGFARFKFPGRDSIFVILIGAMFLPSVVTFIPLYQLFRAIKWTNGFLPLIVPFVFGGPWNIFLLRQMMLNVPREIDEAAWIDGAGTWRTLISILIPQVKPAIVVVSLFSFLGSWKDLLGPLLYLNDAKYYTLPIGLLFFQAPTEKAYTVQLAAVSMALIPTVLLYVFGNRYLERGINIADLK
jgi:multiple sugar transport system permease protein